MQERFLSDLTDSFRVYVHIYVIEILMKNQNNNNINVKTVIHVYLEFSIYKTKDRVTSNYVINCIKSQYNNESRFFIQFHFNGKWITA